MQEVLVPQLVLEELVLLNLVHKVVLQKLVLLSLVPELVLQELVHLCLCLCPGPCNTWTRGFSHPCIAGGLVQPPSSGGRAGKRSCLACPWPGQGPGPCAHQHRHGHRRRGPATGQQPPAGRYRRPLPAQRLAGLNGGAEARPPATPCGCRRWRAARRPVPRALETAASRGYPGAASLEHTRHPRSP